MFSSSKHWLRNVKSCLLRCHKVPIKSSKHFLKASHHIANCSITNRHSGCSYPQVPSPGGSSTMMSIGSDVDLLPLTASSHNTLFLPTFEADEKQKRNLYPHSIRTALYQVRRCFLFHSCTFWKGCWEKPGLYQLILLCWRCPYRKSEMFQEGKDPHFRRLALRIIYKETESRRSQPSKDTQPNLPALNSHIHSKMNGEPHLLLLPTCDLSHLVISKLFSPSTSSQSGVLGFLPLLLPEKVSHRFRVMESFRLEKAIEVIKFNY